MNNKGATGWPWGHNLTKYSGVADKEQKKRSYVFLNGRLQTYTRYSWVACRWRTKKKVLGVFIVVYE